MMYVPNFPINRIFDKTPFYYLFDLIHGVTTDCSGPAKTSFTYDTVHRNDLRVANKFLVS